jgi:hypothetical protein
MLREEIKMRIVPDTLPTQRGTSLAQKINKPQTCFEMEVILFRGTEIAAVSSSSSSAIDVAPRRSVAYLAASSYTRVCSFARGLQCI